MKNIVKKEDRLPREVWIASIDFRDLWPEDTIEKRINNVIKRMEEFLIYEPDIICLLEVFQISWGNGANLPKMKIHPVLLPA
ncbi:hypothetical protein ACFL40_03700 [candidate division KSB1 bacterium]